MHKEQKRIVLQVALFVVTVFSTTVAGSQWAYGKSLFVDYTWQDFYGGLAYSIPLLLILTVHEFGHYFTAIYHKVKTSLPYYIPFPPFPGLLFNIGTMGAVIRLRSRPESNVQNFDIGVAGPLAGFIMALAITFYAFQTLPPAEHIFRFHPEYEQYGADYADVVYTEEYLKEHGPVLGITFGSNLLLWLFEQTVDDPSRIPNAHELMHYPVLLACYIALFITCLNLLPIGQLDGGHVVYGLFGFKKHRMVARVFFLVLVFYAGLGLSYIDPRLPQKELFMGIGGYLLFLLVSFKGLRLSGRDTAMYVFLMFGVQFLLMVFVPGIKGYEGWLLFVFILGRFIGIEHPPAGIEQPLDANRVILGWIALIIFILCFSPAPFQVELITGQE